jgi:hypothetical protein
MPVLLIAGVALATAMPAPAAPASTATAPPQVRCRLPVPGLAGQAPRGAKPLIRQPDGALYLTVDRRIGDCPAPLIIRSGVGG